MSYSSLDYWSECLGSSFDEHGIVATGEQIAAVAGDVQGAAENYDQAFGYDVASKNYQSEKDREIETLKQAVVAEKDKIHCRECNGQGRIYSQGPYHGSDTECWKCRGEGRHAL